MVTNSLINGQRSDDKHVEKLLGHKMVDEINYFLDVVMVTNFALPILVFINKWPGLK
jgi:hypothetical protein